MKAHSPITRADAAIAPTAMPMTMPHDGGSSFGSGPRVGVIVGDGVGVGIVGVGDGLHEGVGVGRKVVVGVGVGDGVGGAREEQGSSHTGSVTTNALSREAKGCELSYSTRVAITVFPEPKLLRA
mmetsp:Transcript_3781/g.8336  ORF Transcript_3781/g.8336 Transcript_3781/m.8336 type:complete len:125 (-) Transcript_3781:193-567(-)